MKSWYIICDNAHAEGSEGALEDTGVYLKSQNQLKISAD